MRASSFLVLRERPILRTAFSFKKFKCNCQLRWRFDVELSCHLPSRHTATTLRVALKSCASESVMCANRCMTSLVVGHVSPRPSCCWRDCSWAGPLYEVSHGTISSSRASLRLTKEEEDKEEETAATSDDKPDECEDEAAEEGEDKDDGADASCGHCEGSLPTSDANRSRDDSAPPMPLAMPAPLPLPLPKALKPDEDEDDASGSPNRCVNDDDEEQLEKDKQEDAKDDADAAPSFLMRAWFLLFRLASAVAAASSAARRSDCSAAASLDNEDDEDEDTYEDEAEHNNAVPSTTSWERASEMSDDVARC